MRIRQPAASRDAAIALAASTTRSRAPRKVACSRVAACSRIALIATAFAASTLRSRQVRRFTKTGAVHVAPENACAKPPQS